MHRSSAPLAVALLAALCCVPSTAAAFTGTVTDFGNHTMLSSMPNFVTFPIGASECDTPMTFNFTGLSATTAPRYIDVWSAAGSSANCQTGTTVRGVANQTTCQHISVSTNDYTGATFAFTVTPAQLFGSCSTDAQRTFYFFDAQSAGDTSTTYTAAQMFVIELRLDVTKPSAASVPGALAGDTSVQVSWTAPSDLGSGTTGVRVYYDPTGCSGGDGGTGSTRLVAGAAPPSDLQVYEHFASGFTQVSVPASNFGWDSTYGQSGALGVTVLDAGYNESVLSNVVCASHVVVTGFWDSYCASRGVSAAECANSYRGCSVALPSRREDPLVVGLGALAVGLFLVRRRRR